MKIKYIFATCAFLTAFSACQPEVFSEADYQVLLDGSNTYLAGEPVKFNFVGNVDNMQFFSGEQGCEYRYRNRYDVALEDVRSALMTMNLQPRYGNPGSMDIYVTNRFDGLDGNDFEADRKTLEDMLAGGMEGWEKISFEEPESQQWSGDQSFDISEYLDNFCIAFHWHPAYTGGAQRTYYINIGIDTDLGLGDGNPSLSTKDLDYTMIYLTDDEFYDGRRYDNPEKNTNGFITTSGYSADLQFQGVGGTELDTAIDAWCVSSPMVLTNVTNDKPILVKNMQNLLDDFEYTWETPGTYTVTFVGINTNYAGDSSLVKEFRITIIDPLDAD